MNLHAAHGGGDFGQVGDASFEVFLESNAWWHTVDAAFGLAEEPPAVGKRFVVYPVFKMAGLDGAEEFGAEGLSALWVNLDPSERPRPSLDVPTVNQAVFVAFGSAGADVEAEVGAAARGIAAADRPGSAGAIVREAARAFPGHCWNICFSHGGIVAG